MLAITIPVVFLRTASRRAKNSSRSVVPSSSFWNPSPSSHSTRRATGRFHPSDLPLSLRSGRWRLSPVPLVQLRAAHAARCVQGSHLLGMWRLRVCAAHIWTLSPNGCNRRRPRLPLEQIPVTAVSTASSLGEATFVGANRLHHYDDEYDRADDPSIDEGSHEAVHGRGHRSPEACLCTREDFDVSAVHLSPESNAEHETETRVNPNDIVVGGL